MAVILESINGHKTRQDMSQDKSHRVGAALRKIN